MSSFMDLVVLLLFVLFLFFIFRGYHQSKLEEREGKADDGSVNKNEEKSE